MGKTLRVPINTETLKWARTAVGYASVEDACAKSGPFRGQPYKLKSLENGEKEPTLNQTRALAKAYGIKEGLLFLTPEQAKEMTPDITKIKDFRMGAGRSFSPELIHYLMGILRKQELLAELIYDDDLKPDLSWIAAFRDKDPKIIASELRRLIWGNNEVKTSLNDWILNAEESLGVAVMQPRPHHSRSIDRQISGVAIDHERIPVVALNTNDSARRRLFTLLHELAHLMIKAPGISSVNYENAVGENLKEERICNAIAENALMPEEIIDDVWIDTENIDVNLKALASKTGASLSASAVRAHHLNLIDHGTMGLMLATYRQKYLQTSSLNLSDGFKGAGRSIIARDKIGPSLTLKSLMAYDEGKLSAMDMYDVFGEKLNHLSNIASLMKYNLVRWQPFEEEMPDT